MRLWLVVVSLFILAGCGERLNKRTGSGEFRGTASSGRSGFGIPPADSRPARKRSGKVITKSGLPFKLTSVREIIFSQPLSLQKRTDANGTIAASAPYHAFLVFGHPLYDVNAVKNSNTVFCAVASDDKALKSGRYEISDLDVGEEWASLQLKVLHWKKMGLKGTRASLYCGFFSDTWREEGLDLGSKFTEKAIGSALGSYADYSPSGTTGK